MTGLWPITVELCNYGTTLRTLVLLLLLVSRFASAQATDVYTVDELQEAVLTGEPHIVIRRHLDTRKPLIPGTCGRLCQPGQEVALTLSPNTKSIRVRCPPSPDYIRKVSHRSSGGASVSAPINLMSLQGNCSGTYLEDIQQPIQPPFVPELTDVQPGHCLLLTDKVMFSVSGGGTQGAPELWLDSLFIRTHREANNQKNPTHSLSVSAANVWLTNVTFQGDLGPVRAIYSITAGRVRATGGPRAFTPITLLPEHALSSRCPPDMPPTTIQALGLIQRESQSGNHTSPSLSSVVCCQRARLHPPGSSGFHVGVLSPVRAAVPFSLPQTEQRQGDLHHTGVASMSPCSCESFLTSGSTQGAPEGL